MGLGVHEAVWSIGAAEWDAEGFAVLTYRTCTRDPVTRCPIVVSFALEVAAASALEVVGCQSCGHQRTAPSIPWPDDVARKVQASRN